MNDENILSFLFLLSIKGVISISSTFMCLGIDTVILVTVILDTVIPGY